MKIGRELDRSRVVDVGPERVAPKPTFAKITTSKIPPRWMTINLETKALDTEGEKLIVNAITWR